jgi:cysteine desulfurase
LAEIPESLLRDVQLAAEANSPFSIMGQFREGRVAYLDMSSTTPMDPRALDAMDPYMLIGNYYGNPHSRTHSFGWEAESAVETARPQAAGFIGKNINPKEIIFTSGATEPNNMVINGAAHFYKKHGKHIITTQTEHKCVLDSCRSLEMEGYKVM